MGEEVAEVGGREICDSRILGMGGCVQLGIVAVVVVENGSRAHYGM